MLSMEQSDIIKKQLQKENVHEFVEKLIMSYATDTNRIGELLALIPRIADRQLQIKRIVENGCWRLFGSMWMLTLWNQK